MKTALPTHAGDVDRALRGQYTTEELLRQGRVAIPVGRLTRACLALGMTYGLCMGTFPVVRGGAEGLAQMLASTLKVPLLFLSTLVVTFPSLYVFSSLAGSRLDTRATLRLLMVAIIVNLALLAGFGPVLAFFALCTESYGFIKLLNVLLFGIAGLISLAILRKALGHVFEGSVSADGGADDSPEGGGRPAPDPAPRNGRAKAVFGVWLLVYGIVGAQMGWVLRPFIGAPGLPFELFRARQSNFFHDVLKTIGAFFV